MNIIDAILVEIRIDSPHTPPDFFRAMRALSEMKEHIAAHVELRPHERPQESTIYGATAQGAIRRNTLSFLLPNNTPEIAELLRSCALSAIDAGLYSGLTIYVDDLPADLITLVDDCRLEPAIH